MSDDEADPELLELLRQSLGITRKRTDEIPRDTGVLKDAQYIYNNAIDVSVDMIGTKAAAASIYQAMQEREYSTETWSQVELHPKASEGFSQVEMINFIFTMDLLNFSFWSALSESERYQVEYRDRRWTGYDSLLAALRRALDEGTPITTPRFWRNGNATDHEIRHVFRSATNEEMPLLDQRIKVLREAADVLRESFLGPEEEADEEVVSAQTKEISGQQTVQESTDMIGELRIGDGVHDGSSETMQTPQAPHAEEGNTTESEPGDVTFPTEFTGAQSVTPDDQTVAGASDDRPRIPPARHNRTSTPDRSVIRLIEKADKSAGKLVNLLAKHFACFDDRTRFDGKRVRLLKRAQILAADLWAAFNGIGYGEFDDIDHLTMFADYRVPQMLQSLGVLSYSPPLQYTIIDRKEIASGHSWEVQLRGCSIWAVELIRREILAEHPEANVNAVLIDFFLYDLAKEQEKLHGGLGLPHHQTRSIWY